MKEKENKENIEEEKCWICKRGFEDVIEEFNNRVLSNTDVDDNIKSMYIKGKKEFFPSATDKYVEFWLADVKDDRYSMSGKAVGNVFIWLCPICCGLLESLSFDAYIDIDNIVTKEDLENVSISIKQ